MVYGQEQFGLNKPKNEFGFNGKKIGLIHGNLSKSTMDHIQTLGQTQIHNNKKKYEHCRKLEHTKDTC